MFSCKMHRLKDFFVYNDTSAIYIDEELFERNKETFFHLIFTYSKSQFEKPDFHTILKEVLIEKFWDKPKLEKFFSNEAIYTLWSRNYLFNQEGFISSEYMRNLSLKFTVPVVKQVKVYFKYMECNRITIIPNK